MIRAFRFSLSILAIALAAGLAARADAPHVYAINGARLVTVAGPAVAAGTIVVRNGLIEAVGAGRPASGRRRGHRRRRIDRLPGPDRHGHFRRARYRSRHPAAVNDPNVRRIGTLEARLGPAVRCYGGGARQGRCARADQAGGGRHHDRSGDAAGSPLQGTQRARERRHPGRISHRRRDRSAPQWRGHREVARRAARAVSGAARRWLSGRRCSGPSRSSARRSSTRSISAGSRPAMQKRRPDPPGRASIAPSTV